MAKTERVSGLVHGFGVLITVAARRHFIGLVLVGCLPIAVGCGGRTFGIAPIAGSLLYEDGTPIPAEGFKLKFVPQAESPDGKSFPRVATALVDAAGGFDGATSYQYLDGVIKGESIVYLNFGDRKRGAELVPAEYLSPKTSPLRIDTSESRTIELRVPRP